VDRGFNDNFLPVWLQEAGYDTYYTGKLFNAHTINNYDSPHVNGFNGSDFLLDPYTYSYLNATYQRNHDSPVSYESQHTTDVITKKALGSWMMHWKASGPFLSRLRL
jgi:Sulfatase.